MIQVQMLRDPLVRNSFLLMLTTALGAGSGFVFWLVVARLFSTDEVGQASSLLSCVALLSYFSLFGLGSAMVRFLPDSRSRAADASTAVSGVVLGGIVVSVLFAIVGPWLAHDLGFVRSSPAHLLLFVVLAVGAAVNLLTDQIFVADRAAAMNLLINGGLMSTAKLVLPLLAVSFGAFGIFAASGLASTVAAAVSIVAIRRRLGVAVRARIGRASLRRLLGYSLGSHLSASLNLVPLITLPIVVLHARGPAESAVYFVAFQIANLVNAVSFAIGESLFAEGSHEPGRLRALAVRSGSLMIGITGVAVLVVALLAEPVLRLFGDDYARGGTSILILLAVSALAVAFNTWTAVLLRLVDRLRALAVANLAFVVVILGVALYGVPHGLIWAGVAWAAGNLAAGLVGAAALVRTGTARVAAV